MSGAGVRGPWAARRVHRGLGSLALAGLIGLGVGGCGGTQAAHRATPSGTGAVSGTASPTTSADVPATVCLAATSQAPGYDGTDCMVAAPSLAGNLLGDQASLLVRVLVPAGAGSGQASSGAQKSTSPEASASAGTSTSPGGRRYPVVYVLAGFQDSSTTLFDLMRGALPDDGTAPGVILVLVGGANALGGSFYANSPVSGHWEDAISQDLVRFVDGRFPTIPAAASRGISGHSMGGSGALNLALHRPDVFGVVYAMSPGLLDPDGEQQLFGDPTQVAHALADLAQLPSGSAAQRGAALSSVVSGEDGTQFAVAYGVAFAGDPSAPGLLRYPFHAGPGGTPVRDDAVWAQWAEGFGDLPGKLVRYRAALHALRGIGVDYGTADDYPWIPKGCHYFAGLLRGAGLPVQEATFVGDHQSQLGDRIVHHLLPFMVAHLAAR